MNIDALISRIQSSGLDLWVSGGASEEQISSLEQALAVKLPPSYKSFLKAYGAISIGDTAVSGIIGNNPLSEEGGSAYGDTKELYELNVSPEGLVVVSRHEDGAFCLDTARSGETGECPVVNFEYGSIQHKEPVAETFEDWLVSYFFGLYE